MIDMKEKLSKKTDQELVNKHYDCKVVIAWDEIRLKHIKSHMKLIRKELKKRNIGFMK